MNPPAAPAVPAWLADELATVPEVDAFAGVDELAAESARLTAAHPDVISSRVIGRSAGNEPLTCLTIDGDRNARAEALVFGLPHPNEPAGGLTSIHLAGRLAADAALRRRLGLTWHVVPVIDPDGLRLNEGWLRGPFTRQHYTRNLFRQAFDEQIDWNFPVGGESEAGARHGRPPETRALMGLINAHRPALLASLHNAELGNVYYYVGRNDKGLIDTLQQIPAVLGMSLYRGVPESVWAHRLSEGVYRCLDIRDLIAYDRAVGRDPTGAVGNSSSIYAARHGAQSVITEVPYWRDPRTSDNRPTAVALVESLAECGLRLRDLGAALASVLRSLDGLTRIDSPFLRAARHFARAAAAEGADALRRAGELPAERVATVAERASIEDLVHLSRLRSTGQLLRALDEEIAGGNPHETIHSVHREVTEWHASWSAEAARDSTAAGVVQNPIGAMVAAQYGSIIAAADRLAGSRGGH
jgi:hypothetical protein